MTDPLQPEPILQDNLRETPWSSVAAGRLPGTSPVAPDDWLRLDDAYGAQMALRDRLIAQRRGLVHALLPEAMESAREVLDQVLDLLNHRSDFSVTRAHVTRPDGITVALDRETPLLTLGRLMQQDFCLLQRQGDEHFLTGAILCFPASWTLGEKIGRPLTLIHDPVAEYTPDLARRVQRLFDAVRPETPLFRVNLLLYQDAALYQPRRVADRRVENRGEAQFVRSERQCISRLPVTQAVVFAIHTTVVRKAGLDVETLDALGRYRPESV